jgi:hypothetical protein
MSEHPEDSWEQVVPPAEFFQAMPEPQLRRQFFKVLRVLSETVEENYELVGKLRAVGHKEFVAQAILEEQIREEVKKECGQEYEDAIQAKTGAEKFFFKCAEILKSMSAAENMGQVVSCAKELDKAMRAHEDAIFFAEKRERLEWLKRSEE